MDRAQDLSLFKSVMPGDVVQGQLGDCWLVSTMSALAEYPECVMGLFEPKKLALDGKYEISIFNRNEERFVQVVG